MDSFSVCSGAAALQNDILLLISVIKVVIISWQGVLAFVMIVRPLCMHMSSVLIRILIEVQSLHMIKYHIEIKAFELVNT